MFENNQPELFLNVPQDQRDRALAYSNSQVLRIQTEISKFNTEISPIKKPINLENDQMLQENLQEPKLDYVEITYDNNDEYEGEMLVGVRIGQGTYNFHNGDVYRGQFVNNQPNGQGELIKANGCIFAGNWKDGALNGKIVIEFPEGDPQLKKFDGEFEDNKANGRGKLNFVHGDVYSGFWENGVYHGKGVMKYANGDIFDGVYDAGVPNGSGTFLYKSVNIFQTKKLCRGIDRVNSNEFKNSTFNIKDQKSGEKALPLSMAHVIVRKNPNINFAKNLLGGNFDKNTNRVLKFGPKKANRHNQTQAIPKKSHKNKLEGMSIKTNKIVEPSRSRSRLVSSKPKVKKLKRACVNHNFDIDWEFKHWKHRKIELTSRMKNPKLDLRDIFNEDFTAKQLRSDGSQGRSIRNRSSGFCMKRTKSMDFAIKQAKQFLSRKDYIIVE